ncbi:hypothetical protein [Entomobacter blattae]|uniref:Uncharacterized protein n=1 Tax=Entomobacter blattae TaxID=2762277 RepID=A0A7H1NP70_9PROT|nr:hypothetical protein [Entomobacter blattae]QNT77580.1 hypothetical protein JGUZn3_03230 [Entomobacter blattae]QNT78431.1 hypothetical protein JGUZn3_12050 [Entomobacter blattae]
MNQPSFDRKIDWFLLFDQGREIISKSEEVTDKAIEAVASAKSLTETIRQASRNLNATTIHNNEEKRKIDREIAASLFGIHQQFSAQNKDLLNIKLTVWFILFMNIVFSIIFSFLLFR